MNSFEMPLFTISYLRNTIKAKVVTLDSILKLGVDERQTVSYFRGKPPTILLGEYGYHELLIDSSFLVQIESFDNVGVIRDHTTIPEGKTQWEQSHTTYSALKNKYGVIKGSRLNQNKLKLQANTEIILPQELVVFSFNYLGYSSEEINPEGKEKWVRCSISAFPVLGIAKSLGLED